MFHTQNQEWVNLIQGFRKRLSEINLPRNIEPSQGNYILSLLDGLYSDIRPIYGDVKKQLDETESLIERIRRKAEASGSNTEIRKANGVRAVEEAELGNGETINLYNIRTALVYQKEDLESLLSIIEKKQSMVITMSGLLKIESNIAGH